MSIAAHFEGSRLKRRALWLACSGVLVGCGLFDFPEPHARAAASGGAAASDGADGGAFSAEAGHGDNPKAGAGGEGCDGSLIFPLSGSAPLDDFLRSNGTLSTDQWIYPLEHGQPLSQDFVVSAGKLTLAGAGELNPILWKTPLGASQEVWATIEQSDLDPSHGNDVVLWLKDELIGIVYWQGAHEMTDTLFDIEIWYLSDTEEYPRFFRLPRLPSLPTTLGGRAFANGCVELFIDNEYFGGGYIGAPGPNGDPGYAPLTQKQYSRPGHIGVGTYGSVVLESFGGGTVPDP